MSAYTRALDALYNRTARGTRFGLERTEALLQLLGDPHRQLTSFHIAGTNGKGSVAATLTALLRAQGLSVGTYTSPHLVHFRERIVVDGEMIPEERVVEFAGRRIEDCERLDATFFEATTALAFDHFARSAVDVAVIETGLGGRLDSTNVVDPLVAGVTSVALDHTDMLGDTLEAIAREKAGVFKRGRAAVVGELDAHIARILAAFADGAGATPITCVRGAWSVGSIAIGPDGTSFSAVHDGEEWRLKTPLIGHYQAQNTITALAMLEASRTFAVSSGEAASGLADVRLAGRFQRSGKYVFDVAHNPAGADVLVRTLAASDVQRPLVALVAVLADKDWRGMLGTLAPVVDRMVLTIAPSAPEDRLWNLDAVESGARGLGTDIRVERDFDAALELASDAATTLVTGSFHTVGDAMSRLQVNPLGA